MLLHNNDNQQSTEMTEFSLSLVIIMIIYF